MAIKAAGGEIVPAEWSGVPASLDFREILPVPSQAPATTPERAPIEVKGAAGKAEPRQGQPPVPGVQAPAPVSPEEQAHLRYLDRTVNYEVNVFRLCHHAVHEMVLLRVREEPPDVAEMGSGMGPATRTPLELAEPQIAVEVYRQVRASMREAERPQPLADRVAHIARILLGGK